MVSLARSVLALVVGLAVVTTVVSERVSASTTFMVTSSSCTGPGSITEAVAAANANPGTDVIEFTPGLQVSADTASCGDGVRWIADVSESVIFEGNGAKLVGAITWVTSGGLVTPLNKCPGDTPRDLLMATSPGFLSVGFFPAAPNGVSVEVRDLRLESLNAIAYFDSDQGSLVLEDVTAERILSHQGSCALPAISFLGQEGDLTLRRNHWDQVINWLPPTYPPVVISEAIQSGTGMGDLVIDDSDFVNVGQGGLVVWTGAVGTTLDIVSSRMTDAGGITSYGAVTTNIVNSVFALRRERTSESDRVFNASSGEMNIVASTFMVGSAYCDPSCADYGVDGIVGRWLGGGPVNLRQSAIGVNIPAVSPGSVLANADKSTSGGFSADADTWIQPVAGQDAAALSTLTGQPGLLTDPPGLATSNFFAGALPAYVAPLLGTTSDPGQLIDKIPGAACGGPNQLSNPIDGSCITTDVFGNSRWDLGNEARNIGAVQLTLAPHLAVSGTGDGFVDLGWNRPVDGTGDSVTGYVVRYRPAGSSGAFTEQSVSGPDALATRVSGLINGTLYEFEVSAVRATAGAGPTSNPVTATPCGPIATPVLSATPGDGEVTLNWNHPDDGGCGLDGYIVSFRQKGASSFTPRSIPDANALQALVAGLINGTEYEFKISGFNAKGSGGEGFASATPWPQPTLSYANPTSWPQNTPLTLVPTVGQLQGSGAYSIESGMLPDGMTLNPSTGVISGTPTTQQSTSATIRLTDGTTGLFTEATVPLSIVAPSSDPQLWYPVIQATVGVGPVSATPTKSGIPAGATYSVLTGDSLPAGFGIDPTTGVISGTATNAPGQVVDITIQACWGSCNPSAGEVRLAPMLFWIVPRLQYPTLTEATAGVAISVTPTVDLWTGGQFSIESGSLPTGMSLDPSTGVISGIPQTAGVYSARVRYSTGVNVLDPPLEYVYAGTQINVSGPTITLTYPAITGRVGQYLSALPTVTGLSGTPIYSLVSGTLPQGLSLNPSTGRITGVPTDRPGSYPAVIQVVDPFGGQRTGVVIELQAMPPTPVPALSPPALALLAMLMALMGRWARKAKRVRP